MEDISFEDLDKYLLGQNGKIIHQVWFSSGFGPISNCVKADKEYAKLKIYRNSWIIKNPSWFRTEWSKKRSNNFLWESFNLNIQVPDISIVKSSGCLNFIFSITKLSLKF